jgi:phosphoribosylformylglycinamidine synthase
MTAYEMMLSESQERMLMVLKPGREAFAEAIFKKWELDFAVIGHVTDTGRMVLEHRGEIVCDIPLAPLADDAPLYDRPAASKEAYKAWAQVKPIGDIPESTDIAADLLKLMASPDIASRRWIWEQYDQKVGGDTVMPPGGDAALVRVHGTNKALAITTDCNPRYCYADPYEGGKQAIAEAYRNISATGATPLAVTNCLNFANPQRPEIMAQIVGCLEGMADACRALDFPIVSGNVSLYNESKATGGGSAILPTPAIGAVGIIQDWRKAVGVGFASRAQRILLIGADPVCAPELGQSQWLRTIYGREDGKVPATNLATERRHGEFIRHLIDEGVATAVHDVSDGGILVAATEMALASGIGVRLELGAFEDRVDKERVHHAWSLFAENQSRYIVTEDMLTDEIMKLASDNGIGCCFMGWTGGDSIALCRGETVVYPEISLDDLRAAHEGFFPALMGSDAALA